MTRDATPSTPYLAVDRVSRRFDSAGAPAVESVSLAIARGEIFALLGPSGCGKSTTLRIVAGLEHPDSGSVFVGGTEVTEWPPERRRMGVVFQNYALFPHLSVFENVAFGLRVRGDSRDVVDRAVREALELVQLDGLERRSVDQLSGGQQQRVALARAIAPRPSVILLDEPLSNLDAALREETRDTLRALLRRLEVTALFVTHDQSEALAFADRLGLMRSGRIVEIGTPDALYNEPDQAFTATFLGAANVLAGTTTGDGRRARLDGDGNLALDIGSWAAGIDATTAGTPVTLVARPEALSILEEPAPNALAARVVDQVFLGATRRLTTKLDAGPTVRIHAATGPTNERVWVAMPPASLRAVRPDA